MIRNDDLNTKRLRTMEGFIRSYTVVNGDENADTLAMEGVHHAPVQAVAVLHPRWNGCNGIGTSARSSTKGLCWSFHRRRNRHKWRWLPPLRQLRSSRLECRGQVGEMLGRIRKIQHSASSLAASSEVNPRRHNSARRGRGSSRPASGSPSRTAGSASTPAGGEAVTDVRIDRVASAWCPV